MSRSRVQRGRLPVGLGSSNKIPVPVKSIVSLYSCTTVLEAAKFHLICPSGKTRQDRIFLVSERACSLSQHLDNLHTLALPFAGIQLTVKTIKLAALDFNTVIQLTKRKKESSVIVLNTKWNDRLSQYSRCQLRFTAA